MSDSVSYADKFNANDNDPLEGLIGTDGATDCGERAFEGSGVHMTANVEPTGAPRTVPPGGTVLPARPCAAPS